MKRYGLFHIILAAFLLTGPSLAQVAYAEDKSVIADEQVDPQRLAAAYALLEASDFERQMSEMLPPLIDQMMDVISQHLGKTMLDPQQRSEFDKVSKLISKAITEKFLEQKPELTKFMALVYGRALTVEELKALTDFQKSPAGRKFNAALPEIMAETVPTIMNAMMTGTPFDSDGKSLDPEKKRAIGEMLEASQYDHAIELMLDQIAQPPQTGALPSEITAEELEEMNAASKAMADQFRSRKQELKEYTASVWGKRLEIEEINAVTSFYKTEAGQQILTSMPKIFEEQQKLQEKMFVTMFSDMDTMIQEIIEKHQSQQ